MEKPNIRLVLILITSSFTGVLQSGRTFALDVDTAKGLIDAGGGRAVDENFIVVANEKLRLAEDPKYVAANNPTIKQDLSEAFDDDFELLSADDFNAEFYPKAVPVEEANHEVAGDGTGKALPPLANKDEDEDEDEEEDQDQDQHQEEEAAANQEADAANTIGGTNEANEDEDVFKEIEVKEVKKTKK